MSAVPEDMIELTYCSGDMEVITGTAADRMRLEHTIIQQPVVMHRTLEFRIEYEDISEDEDTDDVPPPPSTPHPEVLKSLDDVTRPNTLMAFNRSQQICPKLARLLEVSNRKVVGRLNQQLVDSAARCGTVEAFRSLLRVHLGGVETQVTTNRKTAFQYCKRMKVGKDALLANKYAFYKRSAVWRDALKDVKVLAEKSGVWSESRRKMLWGRLAAANRSAWYCVNLMETFHSEELMG